MRSAFIRTLVGLAERDPRLVLLTGDLGFMAIEPFAERFPGRFFNAGAAEQNMVGLATGLAEAGFVPFVYSIVSFAVLRPYEFIRNGPVAHRLPVRIVGVGGGVEYGTNGLSHYGLEDVGVMRLQPGLTIVAPADYLQTQTALAATWNVPGPVYYRLGKDDQTQVPGLDGRFALGRLEMIGQGGDLLLVAMGNITSEAVAAAQLLEALGVRAAVAVIASVSPAPIADLIAVLARYRLALTLEAHYTVGGVGSLVSEVVAEHRLPCQVIRCGFKAAPEAGYGGQTYLYAQQGLLAAQIAQQAAAAWRIAGQ